MESRQRCVTLPDPMGKFFEDLIGKVPESEKEAELIVSTVEKMLAKNPSLSRYIEFDQKEQEAMLTKMRTLGLLS